ncbi:hypothetical protein ERTO105960_09310 [Erysipelothrix tonsillarum]
MYDKAVIVPLPRMNLVLYPSEIHNLIKNDLDLFEKAVKRGKHYTRYAKSYNAVGGGKHATHQDQ